MSTSCLLCVCPHRVFRVVIVFLGVCDETIQVASLAGIFCLCVYRRESFGPELHWVAFLSPCGSVDVGCCGRSGFVRVHGNRYSEISLLGLCTLSSTRIGGSLGAGGGASTAVRSTWGFAALGVAVGALVLGGPLLLFLLFVLYWVLQLPDLVVMDQAYPVHVVKGFAGVAESEVCGDDSFGGILTLEGHNFEGIDPDVMLALGGRVVFLYYRKGWGDVDFPHSDGFV